MTPDQRADTGGQDDRGSRGPCGECGTTDENCWKRIDAFGRGCCTACFTTNTHSLLVPAPPARADRDDPADVFDGSSGDPGPTILALTRARDAADARHERLATTLRELHWKCNHDRCGVTLDWCHTCEVIWPCPTTHILTTHSAPEPDERAAVSRQWAEDWDSPEDSVYDAPDARYQRLAAALRAYEGWLRRNVGRRSTQSGAYLDAAERLGAILAAHSAPELQEGDDASR